MNMPPSVFDVAAVLRALGVTITALPGEYRVKLRNGNDDSARYTEDLAEALELGRELAASRAASPAPTTRPRQGWRPKKMIAKAIRRRRIYRHNYHLRGRALRCQTPGSADD
jgi:hypothetical protein